MRLFLVFVASWVILLASGRARAHGVNLSQSEITVQGATVRALVVFAKPDAVRLGGMDPDQNGVVTAAELDASQSTFREIVERDIDVTADGRRCVPTLEGGGDVAEDGFGLSVVFACAAPPGTLGISMNFLRRLLPGHEQMLHLHAEGADSETVLTAREPRIEVRLRDSNAGTANGGAGASLWGALRLGVEHILTGWDHLLFLLAVLLGTRGLRSVVLAISAFTVAHSMTLALAALDVVVLNPRIIEPAIAASIVFVAFQNAFRPGAPHRWRATLVFGLVHGFGFASALRTLALTRERLLPTLLGFNLGVEAGQLVVVACVLPVLALAFRGRESDARFVRGASLVIGALGCVAFVARVVAPS